MSEFTVKTEERAIPPWGSKDSVQNVEIPIGQTFSI